MTTVYDVIKGRTHRPVLAHLGIDPDTPDEWRTPDHCLTWLRERDYALEFIEPRLAGGFSIWVDVVFDAEKEGPTESEISAHAPTLHAALIAACHAVQEAS